MCVKITLMTRSAYTQPTPVTRDAGRRRLTEIYCPRSQSLRAAQNFRVYEIEGESKSSNATLLRLRQTWKICTFCTVKWSLRCQNIHTSSVHSRLSADCDRSEHDYTTMDVADIKFLLRVQKAETIDFNDTSPKCYDPPPTECPEKSVISQSEDFNQTAWPIRGRECV